MRVGVLGKPHEGECVPGFTRPNSASPCGKLVTRVLIKLNGHCVKVRHVRMSSLQRSFHSTNKQSCICHVCTFSRLWGSDVLVFGGMWFKIDHSEVKILKQVKNMIQ